MLNEINQIESIARRAALLSDSVLDSASVMHPFEERGIAATLPAATRELFDNGHYAQATFEAMKFLESEVRRHSGLTKVGEGLMMDAFSETDPKILLNRLTTQSEIDEQKGFKFLFAGAIVGIRNPRGHEVSVQDSPADCLEHLALVSMLLRRLSVAGYV